MGIVAVLLYGLSLRGEGGVVKETVYVTIHARMLILLLYFN